MVTTKYWHDLEKSKLMDRLIYISKKLQVATRIPITTNGRDYTYTVNIGFITIRWSAYEWGDENENLSDTTSNYQIYLEYSKLSGCPISMISDNENGMRPNLWDSDEYWYTNCPWLSVIERWVELAEHENDVPLYFERMMFDPVMKYLNQTDTPDDKQEE